MKCSGDFEILHEKARDTTRISSCFSDFRAVSRNFLVIYHDIPATPNFL